MQKITMKLPQKDPTPRTTSHGAQMSKRMARFYNFLSDNCVSISDWSTDECVDREYAKLDRLKVALEDLINGDPDKGMESEVYKDLTTLMKRGTKNRITDDKQASEVKPEEQTKGLDDLEDFLKS